MRRIYGLSAASLTVLLLSFSAVGAGPVERTVDRLKNIFAKEVRAEGVQLVSADYGNSYLALPVTTHDIAFSPASDENQLCRFMGYARAVPGSLKSGERLSEGVITINTEGKLIDLVAGHTFHKTVETVKCREKTPSAPATVKLYTLPEPKLEDRLISVDSSLDAVCGHFGYAEHVQVSSDVVYQPLSPTALTAEGRLEQARVEHAEYERLAARSQIDENGVVSQVQAADLSYISTIICRE